MRDDKFFSKVSTTGTPPADALLSRMEWQALPVSTRVCDRLVEILILANEMRAELESEEAAPLRWMVPIVDRVIEQTDEALVGVMSRRAAAVEAIPFSDDADESLCASSDYFWMLRSAIVERHARDVWRSFRDGYATMGAQYRPALRTTDVVRLENANLFRG